MRGREPGVDREDRDLDEEGHEHCDQGERGRETGEWWVGDQLAHVEGVGLAA
jgi:hypothetical protein